MRHFAKLFALIVACLLGARSAPQAQKGSGIVPDRFDRAEPTAFAQKGIGIVPRQKGTGIVPRPSGEKGPPPPWDQQGGGIVPRWVEIQTVKGPIVTREFYTYGGELLGLVVDTGDELLVSPKARGFLTALAGQTPIVKSKGMTRKRIGTPQHPRVAEEMHGNLDYRNPRMN